MVCGVCCVVLVQTGVFLCVSVTVSKGVSVDMWCVLCCVSVSVVLCCVLVLVLEQVSVNMLCVVASRPEAKSWVVFLSYHSLLQPDSIFFFFTFVCFTLFIQLCAGRTFRNLISRMKINFQLVSGFTPYFAPDHHFLYLSGLNFLCKS